MINKVLKEDLELMSAIGLTEEDIENGYEDVKEVIRYLDEKLYRKEIKKIDILHHGAYPGIYLLYSSNLQYMKESGWFNINTFDDLSRAFALLHSGNAIDANLECIVKDVDHPLLSECICYKDELEHASEEFISRVSYLPSRDWIVKHTKIEVAIAKINLHEPLRYFKAYINLHRDIYLEVVNDKDYVESLLATKDYEKEKMYVLLIDMKERGITWN